MKSQAEIILKGFNPDPSIIFDGEFFWCTTSTFEYFPGLPLYKSKDGIKWSFETYILSTPEQLNLINAENSKGGIYAATLRFHNGTYYAITTKGKKSLKEKNEEWKIFSESVNRVIGGVSFAN